MQELVGLRGHHGMLLTYLFQDAGLTEQLSKFPLGFKNLS